MRETLKALLKDRVGRLGLFGMIFILVLAIIAPMVAPYDPAAMTKKNNDPSAEHIFGTDHLGRDVFSRILYGARVSILVGLVSVGIGAALGFLLGVIAGYAGGVIDNIIMRCMDVLFAFPTILLALVIVSVLGPDLVNTMIAIGIVFIPIFTRTVRASVISVKGMMYVSNARSIGITTPAIILRHVIPNALSPFLVQMTLALSSAILTESTMSFLGLGIQPPAPSWGSMLADARNFMEFAPWTAIWPTVFIVITILSFNILGDSLRDVLDPRLKL